MRSLKHTRAAGHGAAVTATFPNNRRRFAGDRGFIDARDSFDHIAIGRNDVARFANNDVALLQDRRWERFLHCHYATGAPSFPCAIWRNAAACALPRPSATASAKLANKTVNQSQIDRCATNPRSPVDVKMPTVVKIAPTIVTNMTGFLIISRGFKLFESVADRGADDAPIK